MRPPTPVPYSELRSMLFSAASFRTRGVTYGALLEPTAGAGSAAGAGAACGAGSGVGAGAAGGGPGAGRRRWGRGCGGGGGLGLGRWCGGCLRGWRWGGLVGAAVGALRRVADGGQLAADLDGVVFVGDDLGQLPRCGRRNLGVALVGGH